MSKRTLRLVIVSIGVGSVGALAAVLMAYGTLGFDPYYDRATAGWTLVALIFASFVAWMLVDGAMEDDEAETGAMISRLARRELGRRALAAIGTLEGVEVGT